MQICRVCLSTSAYLEDAVFLLSNYIKNNAILADVIPTPFDQANERMITCLVAPENFFSLKNCPEIYVH